MPGDDGEVPASRRFQNMLHACWDKPTCCTQPASKCTNNGCSRLVTDWLCSNSIKHSPRQQYHGLLSEHREDGGLDSLPDYGVFCVNNPCTMYHPPYQTAPPLNGRDVTERLQLAQLFKTVYNNNCAPCLVCMKPQTPLLHTHSCAHTHTGIRRLLTCCLRWCAQHPT